MRQHVIPLWKLLGDAKWLQNALVFLHKLSFIFLWKVSDCHSNSAPYKYLVFIIYYLPWWNVDMTELYEKEVVTPDTCCISWFAVRVLHWERAFTQPLSPSQEPSSPINWSICSANPAALPLPPGCALEKVMYRQGLPRAELWTQNSDRDSPKGPLPFLLAPGDPFHIPELVWNYRESVVVLFVVIASILI